MFKESGDLGTLPQDQRLVTIVTIHKEGKPKMECASYRPISLLNTEPKILAKVIENRLIKTITKLVHPDQSGFMPHRNTALNIRQVHGVMGRADTIRESSIIVFLVAAMAFGTLE